MAGKSGRSINNVPKVTLKDRLLSWEGILVILLILVNVFCANYSEFYNFKSVMRQMPTYLAEVLLLLPMAYILILGEIDISVGSIVCLSATMSCLISNQGAQFIVVILATLLVGTLCGMVNGLIVTKFEKLPPMIVTLATQIIFRGIAEIVLGSGGSISASDSKSYSVLSGKFKDLMGDGVPEAITETIGRIPYILVLVLILAVLFGVILSKSTFGRRVYAIGTNRLAAYYSGIHVQKIRFLIYTVMGTMAGMCALFLISISYSANTTTGTGYEMNAIAMAVFGGISSTGGKGNLFGGIISAFIILCLRIGLGQANVHAQVILLILGVLLICAVALPNIAGQVKRVIKK